MRPALLVLVLTAACGSGAISGDPDGGSTIDIDADPLAPDAAPDAAPGPDAGPAPYGVQRPVRKDTTDFDVPPPLGYYEYLPAYYEEQPTRQWPIILFFEGISERGDGLDQLPRLLATGLPQVIEQGNFHGHDRFIVLSVQYSGYAEPEVIDGFLDWAKAHYRIDTTRMYLTGLSYGAFATWGYGMARGDASQFAAYVPISGNDGVSDGCQFKHRAVWAFHGRLDANLPYTPADASVYSVQRINDCMPDVRAKVTIFPDTGHDPGTWNGVYAETRQGGATEAAYAPFDQSVYAWLLQYHR
jgi:predicted peptidase